MMRLFKLLVLCFIGFGMVGLSAEAVSKTIYLKNATDTALLFVVPKISGAPNAKSTFEMWDYPPASDHVIFTATQNAKAPQLLPNTRSETLNNVSWYYGCTGLVLKDSTQPVSMTNIDIVATQNASNYKCFNSYDDFTDGYTYDVKPDPKNNNAPRIDVKNGYKK